MAKEPTVPLIQCGGLPLPRKRGHGEPGPSQSIGSPTTVV